MRFTKHSPKKFPATEASDLDRFNRPYIRQAATRYYLFGLIATHRGADAVKVAREFGSPGDDGNSSIFGFGDSEQLSRAGLAAQTQAFLRELLAAEPGLSLWDDFITVSARTNRSRDALAFLREVSSRPGLSEADRTTVRSHLWGALLAADEVDEGVNLLRETLTKELAQIEAAFAPTAPRAPQGFPWLHSHKTGDDAYQLSLRLASLGRLLEKPEWVAEGLAARHHVVASERDQLGNYAIGDSALNLLDNGFGPEAEKTVLDGMMKAREAQGPAGWAGSFSEGGRQLAALVEIYHQAGRYADVLHLLTEAKGWGARDITELSDHGCRHQPFAYFVAHALAEAGRTDEARRILIDVLENHGGFDPAYALLLKLGGDDLPGLLDRLAARDRFEERPLIWKATLQLDAGLLDAAEKTVRAAIAIDPSDGEQGKGDRLRAYAVLGDILEKKGDDAQAKTMRGAVAAIRLSENADDRWKAGLLTHAVRLYEEALTHFADAYCIQSRLALRYAELGDDAKAEEHYRRAYELMPDSFGRMESHCFGCEGAFRGERAQNLAEQVFTQLAARTPNKPQVFYLLGYLREAQERYTEAAASYRKAIQLDPDYLNAWKQLLGLRQRIALSRTDSEAIGLALVRIDPLDRHGDGSIRMGLRADDSISSILNFRALWPLLETRIRLTTKPASDLFPLTASRTELKRQAKATGYSQPPTAPPQAILTPGEALLRHGLISSIVPLFLYSFDE